ncbi:MAG TPA: cyclic nucleotide-binding domain-containing protein [Xanthobacteraceae bacterium]
MPMPLIPNIAIFQRKLAGFPIATYQAGETVLTAASTSGRLLILRKGAVAVLKEGVEIATVTEPGAVFGELSVLLDQPHTRMYARWRPRSFTWPMRPPCSG